MSDSRSDVELDVVIIGGGAAGIAAARSARAAGAARVGIVSAGAGATEMTAGWIAASGGELNADALRWLEDAGLRPMGAYAFATLSGALAGALSGLYSLLDLTELPDGPLGVVEMIAGPSWSAAFLAQSLARAVGREVRVVDLDSSLPRAESLSEIARALDTIGQVDGIAEQLRERSKGVSALLFPPVLGLARDDVAARLTNALGMPVGEAGGGSGDPPAMRLARALARGIPGDVTRWRGRAKFTDGSRRPWVEVDRRTLKARAIVLATGGLAGGGIVFDGNFREYFADAPVWIRRIGHREMILPSQNAERGMDPQRLFSPDHEDQTEAAAAGVRLTPERRIVGSDGKTPMHPWLFAAGAVAGGSRSSYGPSLAEVLVSGYEAGRHAARHAASV